MTQSIPLIDKSDNFEIILDKIASILATETAAQQALAVLDAQDPDLYKFKVYKERINPWEAFIKSDDPTPIVNVWVENLAFERAASNVMTRQKTRTRYNVDIYAYAESEETPGGHTPGDEAAALLAHNTAKLVRNILMHDKYVHLDLDGIVWVRWTDTLQTFQPTSGDQAIQRTVACRLALDVEHNETIELEDHETLEITNVKFYYETDGQIIAELQYGVSP